MTIQVTVHLRNPPSGAAYWWPNFRVRKNGTYDEYWAPDYILVTQGWTVTIPDRPLQFGVYIFDSVKNFIGSKGITTDFSLASGTYVYDWATNTISQPDAGFVLRIKNADAGAHHWLADYYGGWIYSGILGIAERWDNPYQAGGATDLRILVRDAAYNTLHYQDNLGPIYDRKFYVYDCATRTLAEDRPHVVYSKSSRYMIPAGMTDMETIDGIYIDGQFFERNIKVKDAVMNIRIKPAKAYSVAHDILLWMYEFKAGKVSSVQMATSWFANTSPERTLVFDFKGNPLGMGVNTIYLRAFCPSAPEPIVYDVDYAMEVYY